MKFLLFLLFGTVALATEDETGSPVIFGDGYLKVKTSNGDVQGYLAESCRTAKKYAGFLGIPYAQPPVGNLRFKAPIPTENWSDVWDATYQRPSCIQEGFTNPDNEWGPDFSEDCLYLNVYTPHLNYLKLRLGSLKPVMVFIHPGAFNTGSSSKEFYSPDFLIDQDVLVVTFNYRLGAFGFLSFQNEDVPGNAGLKDQTLVLKWVKENIRSFGGDPDKITIFGESAGSASVNYHLLSKSSAGLFRSAIMQSGTALSTWAYSPPNLAFKKAFNLGVKVGCLRLSIEKMLECMQKVSVKDIVQQQQKALTLQELFSLRVIAFHPTTEPDYPGAFITEHPYDLMNSGNFTKVPTIIGLNSEEGLLLYSTLTKEDPKGYLLSLLGMDLSRFVPYNFHVKPFTKAAITAHRLISEFYFKSIPLSKEFLKEALDLLTDVMFTLPSQLTASLISDSSVPVYNYLFTYDGGYNIVKYATGIQNVSGVCHGDDLGYLFYVPLLHSKCGRAPVSPDETTIDRMTQMWANFAKTGNPTPTLSTKIPKWKPFTKTQTDYLEIGANVKASTGLKLSNMLFWEDLLNRISAEENDEQGEAIDALEVPAALGEFL